MTTDLAVHPVEALILSSLRAANQGDGTVLMTKADLEAIRDFLFDLQRREHRAQIAVNAIMQGER